MVVGVPKEVKNHEYRVALTPAGALEIKKREHRVIIQAGAGLGSGFDDSSYTEVGVEIVESADEVFSQADMIMKVKEPLPSELPLLKEGQVLYTFLHLAASPETAQELIERGVVGIAYETIQLDDGSLPLLMPMSEIAGRMAIQVGAHYLEKGGGGRGVLLGEVPGVPAGKVVIIGAGQVGLGAGRVAAGVGAQVTIIDRDINKLRHVEDVFGSRVTTMASNEYNIGQAVEEAHLLIGGVLIPGGKTPLLVSEQMVKNMKPGSVIVDVSVDQGGCIATSKVTTHSDPVFDRHGVIHYGVANMPGAVPYTSTHALTNATIGYALSIVDSGWEDAAKKDITLAAGVNTADGKMTHEAVAESLGREFHDIRGLVG